MPLTTLDPKVALIVIDLQKGIVGFPTVDPIAPVIANAAELARTFRSHKLPVVLVNVTGGAAGRTEQSFREAELPADFAELIPELEAAATDILVSKQTWGAFSNPDLAQTLKAGQVTQVVVVGVATSMGVESTARQAHELGLNVTLVTDAMTDMSAESQENSVTRVFPKLGETGSSQQILALLGARR